MDQAASNENEDGDVVEAESNHEAEDGMNLSKARSSERSGPCHRSARRTLGQVLFEDYRHKIYTPSPQLGLRLEDHRVVGGTYLHLPS